MIFKGVFEMKKFRKLARAAAAVSVSGIAFLGTIAIQVPGAAAMAATQYTMVKKQISANGNVLSAPYGFVYGGTTYMPLWYVMQALKSVQVQNTWSGQAWNITVGNNPNAQPAVGNGAVQVYVNGTLIYRVNRIATVDPASKQATTFIPVYAIMQILKAAGLQNTWNGTQWSISSAGQGGSTTTNPGGQGGSTTGKTGQGLSDLLSSRVQNQATTDETYWKRAGSDLYADAMSYDPAQSSQGTQALMNAQPGQTIYLFLHSSKFTVSQAQWFVNSPNGTVTAVDGNSTWTLGTQSALEYKFVAQKPGIYTLQASSNGEYSVPLVLTVGLNQLTGTPVASPAAQSGILPLPASLPAEPWSTGSWPTSPLSASDTGAGYSVLYKQYAAQNGWIPVYGRVTTPGQTSMVVDFSNDSGTEEQNYTLPVHPDGTFGALLEVPISGNVNVALVPDFLHELSTQNMQNFYQNAYSVTNTAQTLTQQQQGLLASATMDFNLTPAMNQTASLLMENAPSLDAGIAAVANYVADKVKYDWVGYQAGNNTWQDATIVWSNNLGVCQDIAELTASMLKSVGVPTLTIVGTAPKGQQTDDHEWIEVWNGAHWTIMDPTWNSPSNSQTTVNDTLSSEYMTLTDSFQTSHTADISKIGTWQ